LSKDVDLTTHMINNGKLKKVIIACLVGWLIPGAGHLFIKDKKRGMVIFALLTITFFSVILMHGKIYTPLREGQQSDKIIALLATVAELGNGIYYFATIPTVDVNGDLSSVYYEVGTIYGIISGLLNILVLFNLFDLIVKQDFNIQNQSGLSKVNKIG
jgi:hypothetical protein